MSFDVRQLLDSYANQNYDLHRDHVNPQFARVLKTIGFDRVYVKAQGPYLWDTQGNKYLDFQGGYAVHNVGRNHPVVKQALIDFLNEDYPTMVAFDGPLLAGVLAKELKQRIDVGFGKGKHELDYVFFTNSGTEGIEAAIKFAKCATGRPGLVYTSKAFHGLSSGSLSINGDESFREGFSPFLPSCVQIPFNDLAALEQALSKRDIAAFIVEPIQGKGVNVPTAGYLRDASALCKRYGTLFVVDEIQTGIGRTGTFLAIEQDAEGLQSPSHAVDPDIIVLSKALSGGYVPVGAVLTRRSVWEKVFSSMERAIVHSSTFHQGSLSMIAGLAVLKVMDDENLYERASRMGEMLMSGLRAMQPRFEMLKEVRGKGLMIGIEFGSPKSLGLRAGWTLVHKMDANLFPQAVVLPLMDNHRIITQVAGHHIDVIKLIPPLTINEDDVKWFLTAFEDVMVKLHSLGGAGPVWEVMKKLGKHAMTRRNSAHETVAS